MPRRPSPTRTLAVTVALAVIVAVGLAACSSSKEKTATTTTSTLPPGQVTTTTTPDAQGILFSATDGNIDAYLPDVPYTRQRVVAAGTGPAGTVPHGQVCFVPDGSRRFVIAETRIPTGAPAAAGWGVYQLTGDEIGSYRVRRIGGWDSAGAPSTDAPTTYGCAFLPDGRLFTTDVGNATTGAPTGRLVEWFGPFDGTAPSSCVIAVDLASPRGLAADPEGALYLASSRAPTAGLWRYRGTFPSDAAGCVTATPEPPDQTTTTTTPPTTAAPGAPTTSVPAGPAAVTVKLLVPGGTEGLNAPTAVAVAPSGQALVVTSAEDGRIVVFDLDGTNPAAVLEPSPEGPLGAEPFAGGSPSGVAVGPDGAVLYSDLGLQRGPDGTIAPGDRTGSLRRVDTTGGQVAPPDAVDTGLHAPDGLGLFLPSSASGGSASKA